MPQSLTTTLADLRKHGACISGYNKLVRAIQGKPFTDADADRDTYIRFAHKDPVELIFILDSNGLDDALWCLRSLGHEHQRTCRLFAVWCARQVQHLMTDERSLTALDVAERHANGEATDQELAAARDAARDAAWAAARAAAWAAARDAARADAWAAARDAAWAAAWAAARADAWAAARDAAWAAARDAARADARDVQSAKFREMCRAGQFVPDLKQEDAAQ